jgi:hypothetical protein
MIVVFIEFTFFHFPCQKPCSVTARMGRQFSLPGMDRFCILGTTRIPEQSEGFYKTG